jgi:hypothetical protein
LALVVLDPEVVAEGEHPLTHLVAGGIASGTELAALAPALLSAVTQPHGGSSSLLRPTLSRIAGGRLTRFG